MNRKVIFTIGLIILLCTGCDRDISSSQKEEENSYIENEHMETSTEEDMQMTETQESIYKADEGWILLTNEELDWFNNEFFNNLDNQIVHYFLDNEFMDVKDVDLFRLFYDLPQTQEDALTEGELRAIEKMGVDIGLDVQKVSTEYMDEVLKTYANITLEESNKENIELFVYLAEYDAYYMSRGDCHYRSLHIIWGQKDVNGVVRLQYEDYASAKYEVTLAPNESGYYFVSNIKIDK